MVDIVLAMHRNMMIAILLSVAVHIFSSFSEKKRCSLLTSTIPEKYIAVNTSKLSMQNYLPFPHFFDKESEYIDLFIIDRCTPKFVDHVTLLVLILFHVFPR